MNGTYYFAEEIEGAIKVTLADKPSIFAVAKDEPTAFKKLKGILLEHLKDARDPDRIKLRSRLEWETTGALQKLRQTCAPMNIYWITPDPVEPTHR